MSKMTFIILISILFGSIASCTTNIEDPPANDPDEKETFFKPGEYGGEPLPDTEHLLWISPSPDGEKIALIRERTPGELDPLYQLWIVDQEKNDVYMVTYNIQTFD